MAEIQPNKKVSEEAAATALASTDLFRLVQGLGTTLSPWVSVKATAAQLSAYFAGSSDPTKVPIRTTAIAYTYSPADAGSVVRHTGATPTVVTIDTNANQAFALTQVVTSRQVGAGQLTFTPAAGVTLNVPTGTFAKTRAQGSVVMLHYVSANVWDITGDLATT